MSDLVERLHQDLAQLRSMTEQVQFVNEGCVRVKNPSLLIMDLREAAAEIERLREQLASARKALEFIRDGYGRADINHVDFRVSAYKAALDALTDDLRSEK